jgi:hypothetical protein
MRYLISHSSHTNLIFLIFASLRQLGCTCSKIFGFRVVDIPPLSEYRCYQNFIQRRSIVSSAPCENVLFNFNADSCQMIFNCLFFYSLSQLGSTGSKIISIMVMDIPPSSGMLSFYFIMLRSIVFPACKVMILMPESILTV